MKTANPRPKIVCLCGSTRFMDDYVIANRNETLAGNIVLSIGVNMRGATINELGIKAMTTQGILVETQRLKTKLDQLHLAKIDLADEIFVINVGGYIGDSTRYEIEYAKEYGKPVRYLEPPADES